MRKRTRMKDGSRKVAAPDPNVKITKDEARASEIVSHPRAEASRIVRVIRLDS